MAEIIRKRTIRLSTRLEKSKSYKIDTKNVYHGDILIVNIDHETKPFNKTYKFNGSDLENKDSISFRLNNPQTSIDITWSRVNPIETTALMTNTLTGNKSLPKKLTDKVVIKTNMKSSFDAISNHETTFLILGTIPGDESLELGEYYGNSKNRFWKIISTITNNDLPTTYSNKINLLINSKIGIWDVAHKAIRKGSLDKSIREEEPNDLNIFIESHPKLKVIAFNGLKSQKIFNKYFKQNHEIEYLTLQSSSSANNKIPFDEICKSWGKIFTNFN